MAALAPPYAAPRTAIVFVGRVELARSTKGGSSVTAISGDVLRGRDNRSGDLCVIGGGESVYSLSVLTKRMQLVIVFEVSDVDESS